jgi:hypothetical protein
MFPWTSCRICRFIHQFGVFGGQVADFAGLSTDLAFLVDKLIVDNFFAEKTGRFAIFVT